MEPMSQREHLEIARGALWCMYSWSVAPADMDVLVERVAKALADAEERGRRSALDERLR